MNVKVIERIKFKASENFKGKTESSERIAQVDFSLSTNSIHVCEGCFTCLDFSEYLDGKSGESDHSNFIDWKKILSKNDSSKNLGTKCKLTLSTSGTLGFKNSKMQELKLKLESAFLKDILTSSYMRGYGYAYLTIKICNPQSHQESDIYLTAVRCTNFDQESNKMQICVSEDTAYCEGVMELPETWKCLGEPANNDGADRFYFADVLIKVDIRETEPNMFSLSDVVDINKLLEGQDETDIEILAGNMTPVKCHRVILSAQSQVFHRILKANPVDTLHSQLQIEDMTEEGVKALLRFLYYRDMTKANKKNSIALELLKFSNKYFISQLESAMKYILFSKPNDWYEVNATIRLFVYANKQNSYYDLKIKSIKVLYERSCEVVSSTVYNQLFREEPETVKELVDALLSYKLLLIKNCI